jgi:AcrR family transcriptional regulator
MQMPDKLAQSAFALFSRHGISNVSLDQIAARAGVTKGSLYWHYKSKDELIKAACGHYYQLYYQRINAALARLTDPVSRLEQTLRHSVRICLLDNENRVFTTEIYTLALTDPETRRGWKQFYDSVRAFYIGLVQAAAATGRISTPRAARAVDFMLATMEGLKLQALYDATLCTRASEAAIVGALKQSLGFPRGRS